MSSKESKGAQDLGDRVAKFLRSKDLLSVVSHDLEEIGIVGEERVRLIVYLAMTSRLLDHPINVRLLGVSSAGKSYIVNKVAELMPEESVLEATNLSAKSLYGMGAKHGGDLSHRIVVCGERAFKRDPDLTLTIREMISKGRITNRTMKGTQSLSQEVKGPIAFFETTTQSRIHDEDRNRYIQVRPDDSREQTRRILESDRSSSVADREAVVGRLRDLHREMQRSLKSLTVQLPEDVTEGIIQLLPEDQVESRRAKDIVRGLVAACALLHQRQRQVEGQVLIATTADLEAVKPLLEPWLEELLCAPVACPGLQAPEAAREPGHERLLRWIEQQIGSRTFTKPELTRGGTKFGSPPTVAKHLDALIQDGRVVIVKPHAGPKPAEYRLASAASAGSSSEEQEPSQTTGPETAPRDPSSSAKPEVEATVEPIEASTEERQPADPKVPPQHASADAQKSPSPNDSSGWSFPWPWKGRSRNAESA